MNGPRPAAGQKLAYETRCSTSTPTWEICWRWIPRYGTRRYPLARLRPGSQLPLTSDRRPDCRHVAIRVSSVVFRYGAETDEPSQIQSLREAPPGLARAAAGWAAIEEASYELASHAVQVRLVGSRLSEAASPLLRASPPARAAGDWSGADHRALGSAGDRGAWSERANWRGLVGDADRSRRVAVDLCRPSVRGVSISRFLSVLDRQAQRLVGWRERTDPLPIHERSKPQAMLLSVWYSDRDVQTVHAGLVSRGDQGVLIAGPSRSGKSSAALTCLSGRLRLPWRRSVRSQGVSGRSICRLQPVRIRSGGTGAPGAVPSVEVGRSRGASGNRRQRRWCSSLMPFLAGSRGWLGFGWCCCRA